MWMLLSGGTWEPKWSFWAAEPQHPCEAAPRLSTLAHLAAEPAAFSQIC